MSYFCSFFFFLIKLQQVIFMVKEVPISKPLLDALVSEIQSLAGIFEKNLPNERQILQSRLYELKTLGRELIDVARIRHPELLGTKATSTTVNIELTEIEVLFNTLRTANLPDVTSKLRNASDISRLEMRKIKLTEKLKRLLELEKLNPTLSVKDEA